MTVNSEADVQAEIEALHEFFVGWFSGSLEEADFQPGFLSRFDENFLLIPPAGVLLTLDEIADSVRSAHQQLAAASSD